VLLLLRLPVVIWLLLLILWRWRVLLVPQLRRRGGRVMV